MQKTTFLVRRVKNVYTRITVAPRCHGARRIASRWLIVVWFSQQSTPAFSGWCADHLSSPARIPRRLYFFFYAFPLTFRSRSHCGIKRSIVDRLTADLEKMMACGKRREREWEERIVTRIEEFAVTLLFYFSLVKNRRSPRFGADSGTPCAAMSGVVEKCIYIARGRTKISAK